MPYNPRAVVNRAALAYGANPDVLHAIGRRESGFRNVVNNWDSNAAAGTPSASWFQFIQPTYNAFSRQAREANPDAWAGVKDDWRDPMAQALTTAWAITNGKGSHWATYKAALKEAGAQNARGPASTPQRAKVQPQQPSYGLVDAGPLTSTNLLDDGSFLKGYLQRRASDPIQTLRTPAAASAPRGRAPASKGGVPPRRPGETGQQYLDRVLMSKFGLKHDPGNGQTTGGKHKGRGHYDGRAADFGDALNTPAQLQAAEDFVDANADALGVRLSWYGNDDDPSGVHKNHFHGETHRSMKGSKR